MRWLSHRPAEELYDLESDPFEMKNLASDPRFAGIRSRLSRELDAWMAQQGDRGMETELKAKARQPSIAEPDVPEATNKTATKKAAAKE